MTHFICSRCLSLRLQRTVRLHARRRRERRDSFAAARPPGLRWDGFIRSFCTQSIRRLPAVSIASDTRAEVPIDTLSGTPGLQTASIMNGIPSIREYLQAWLRKHEEAEALKAAEETVDGKILGRGRVWKLPDALFMAEPEQEFDSAEQEASMQAFNDLIEGSPKHKMSPGELVWMVPPYSRRQIAVYLGQVDSQDQYLLGNGRYTQIRTPVLNSETIPGFAPLEEVEAVRALLPKKGIIRQIVHSNLGGTWAPYMGDVPSDAAEPIVRRIRQLELEMLEFRRNHASMLDNLYERLAKDDEYIHMPFHYFLQQLLGEDKDRLAHAARMAICHMMTKNPTRTFLYATSGQLTLQLLLGPKNLVRRFEDVVTWARDYQELAASASKGENVRSSLKNNPVNSFINKARRIILKSRKIRSPTTIGCLGPTSNVSGKPGSVVLKPSGETFSEDDRSILEFIWDTYIRKPNVGFSSRTSHHAIGSIILRAIGAYPKMILENKIGRLVLQELGAMAPWATSTYDNVLFPIPGYKGAHRATNLQKAADEAAAKLLLETPAGRPLLRDSMEDLREDLGSMEVLCIDPSGTTLVDDGISLEPSTEHPNCYWIHVHVAHPSAFIDPQSVFGQLARHQHSNWYTVAGTYSMLPDIVSDSLSLKSGSAALTTSTLVNEDGEVLDIKIRPTRIHNVVTLATAAVDELLGLRKIETVCMIVGSDPSVTADPDQPVKDEHRDAVKVHEAKLRKLDSLLIARCGARERRVPELISFEAGSYTEQTCSVSFLEEYRATRLYESCHYEGDPTIKVIGLKEPRMATFHDQQRYWQNVVNSSMQLAGESAAKWLKDRNIPAVFTAASPDPAYPVSRLNNMKEGEWFITPKSFESEIPRFHVILNMDQYLRFTSPLRRFADLLAAWNTDAYLRAEAEGTIRGGAAIVEGTFPFPYSRSAVRGLLKEDGWIIKQWKNMTIQSYLHWAYNAFFRAFHFKEAELPPIWDAVVSSAATNIGITHPDTTPLVGTMYPFSLRTVFLKTEEGWEYQANHKEFLPVKIEQVDVTAERVLVRAVGPPSRTPNRPIKGDFVIQSKERRLAAERAKEENQNPEPAK